MLNTEYQITKFSSDAYSTSTFDIPCSIFNIQGFLVRYSLFIKAYTMKNKLLFLLLVFFATACADLEEEVFDEVQVKDVEALLENPTPEFLDNFVASAYAELIPNFTERNYFNLQESTSDISMTPTRLWQDPSRSDWFDGGR